MESQIAPIEDRVRAMVVDIVRTSQSTVVRNYNLMIAPTSSADHRAQSHSPTVNLNDIGVHTREGRAPLPTIDAAENAVDLYREPPHLSTEASTPSFDPFFDPYFDPYFDPVSSVTGPQDLGSDSGYSSNPHSCACSCHSNTWNVPSSKKFSNCAPDVQLNKRFR